jgi:hypothetical protein
MGTVTTDTVLEWLDRYVEAWRTGDDALVRGLFTEDATYVWHQWHEPVEGIDAIAEFWNERADDPSTWTGRYRVRYASDGLAVVEGWTSYEGGRTYRNLWLLAFEGDRCSEFSEWFALRPKSMDGDPLPEG